MMPESLPVVPDLRDIALLSIRFGAALRLAPFFGGFPLGRFAWVSISIALAWLLIPEAPAARPAAIGYLPWFGLAAKELLIGVLIGLMARIAFSVLEITGDLTRIGTLSIPDAGEGGILRGAPLTQAYTLLGTAIFLLIGGHHAFVAGLGSTVACLPPGALPDIDAMAGGARPRILALVGSAMGAGVLLSAPAFVAGVSSELLVGILGRIGLGPAAPQGLHALRVLLVQLLIIAAFGTVVSGAVAFLMAAIERMSVCP